MGMFDTFYFADDLKANIPKGKENDYQSKDFDQELNEYFVDKDFNVTGVDQVGSEISSEINLSGKIYWHEEPITSNSVKREFKIMIFKSKLIYMKETKGWMPQDEFGPNYCEETK